MPYSKKSPAKKPLVGKQIKLDKNNNGKLDKEDFKMLGKSPANMNQQAKDDLKYMPVDDRAATMKKGPVYMNSYDKDMMHERELIYDAKKQAKTGDPKTKKNDKKLIDDAKGQIHNEDIAKKRHVVNEIAGRNSRMA